MRVAQDGGRGAEMRTQPTVWMVFAILIAAPFGALAQEGEDSAYEQSVEVSDDEAVIETSYEADDEEAEVEIRFSTEDASFLVEAESENATRETEQALEAQLHQLVEYTDENDNGKYDDGEPVASSWLLSEGSEEQTEEPANGTVSWQPLNVSETESDEGEPGHHIQGRALFVSEDPIETVTAALGQGENRTFGIDLWVYSNVTQHEGQLLTPSEVKADLMVENYPYVKEGTDLALLLDTEAEQEIEAEDEEGVGSGVDLGDLEADLRFTWADEATVDGETQPVGTTLFESENETEQEDDEVSQETERSFALSYPRGDKIVHDPRVGAQLSAQSAGGLDGVTDNVPSVGLIGLLAVAGAIAVALGRR